MRRIRWPRPRAKRGFSLVEALMAIVIIGVALAGMLSAFQVAVGRSSDPLVTKQLLSIAETLMEEVMLRPYTPQVNLPPSTCARDTFNDVDDYQGYGTLGQICTLDGTAIPALNGYSVSVMVAPSVLEGITLSKRVEVNASRGNESVRLVSWKTNLAMP